MLVESGGVAVIEGMRVEVFYMVEFKLYSIWRGLVWMWGGGSVCLYMQGEARTGTSREGWEGFVIIMLH